MTNRLGKELRNRIMHASRRFHLISFSFNPLTRPVAFRFGCLPQRPPTHPDNQPRRIQNRISRRPRLLTTSTSVAPPTKPLDPKQRYIAAYFGNLNVLASAAYKFPDQPVSIATDTHRNRLYIHPRIKASPKWELWTSHPK